MKKTILALALLALVPALQATTVTISGAASGPSVFLPDGVTLALNGSLIRVGTLDIPGVASSFVEFGTSTVKRFGPGLAARDGKIAGAVTNNGGEAEPGAPIDPNHDSQFNGDLVYIWIYNATTADPLAPQGLFRAEVVAGGSNTFPNNDGPTGLNDGLTNLLATSFLTAIPIPGHLVQASVNMTGDNGTGNATGGRFVLGAVPEPSISMLAMGAVMALGFRRRR